MALSLRSAAEKSFAAHAEPFKSVAAQHRQQAHSGEEFHAHDQCRRWLPDPCRGRGPRERAGADAVELARHRSAHVGRPGRRIRQAFPPDPLRPPRPRPIRRAARAPIRWSASAATCSPCSTRSRSRRPTGAGCRWAAWSGNGSAPTRPTASRSSCSSNTNSYYADKSAVERPHQVRARERPRRLGRRQHGALVHRGLPRRAPETIARMKTMFVATDRDGYIACCAGGPRHGLPRQQSAHHRADAGHRRQPGPRHAARGRREQSRSRSRAPSSPPSTPRISPMSSSRRPTPRPCSNFLRRREQRRHGREENATKKAWRSAARCWATPGSTAPMRARRRSRKNSRTSSPAPPGARSGRGRISTSAPAASW